MPPIYRLWSQVLINFITPQLPKFAPNDRKLVVVGSTKLLTQSQYMLKEPSIKAWYVPRVDFLDISEARSL
jgi:exportin-2 (importin alpha re-exporter)